MGNTIDNAGDSTCGGIHAGIDLGTHMWGGGCSTAAPAAVGNAGCTDEPSAPAGSLCPASGACQKWAFAPAGSPLLLRDNKVTGAHVNYLVEGVDGTIVESGNDSASPRATDWGAAADCGGVSWSPSDRIAHHPSLTGWTDKRIHCER